MEKLKTLIITNSEDATTDLIIFHLGPENVFRLNYDQWDTYDLMFDGCYFEISSQSHRISSTYLKKAYWRKPFINDVTDNLSPSSSLNKYINGEVKYCIKEIFALCIEQNKAVLLSPFNLDRFGKLSQKRFASKYFKTAKHGIYWHNQKFKQYLEEMTVAKALSSPVIDEDKFLYTSRVSKDQLDIRYPWYLEEEIEASEDLTVVYLGGELFCYKLNRNRLKTPDWRLNAAGNIEQDWLPTTISEHNQNQIRSLMNELNLKFGRLDFLIKHEDNYFLEVNPNGQWAWLDVKNDNGLLKRICEILDPRLPAVYILPTNWA